MDATTNYDASSPPASLYSGGPGSELNKSSISSKTSSFGDTLRDSESSGEVLARYELDIACISEKLTNLNLLSMHVENKESDLEAFETFVSDVDPDLVVKVLEYNILSGFLDSEVNLLETYICELQFEKANVSEFLSSRKHMGEPLIGMEDMLHDSEISLERSMEQVLEIKIRTDNFDRNLSRFAGDEDYTDSLNNSDPLELKEKMKMQTVEHQRHVLRMLEKSLEREIDLEKRVSELTQIEEALKIRLHLSEKEVFNVEDEAETILEKLYETNHTSDLLMETSRELISKIKMLEFNLKGSVQREAELKNALLKLQEQFNEKEYTVGIVKMERTIKDLREEIIVAKSRVVNAEDNCQFQTTKTTQELKDTYEKVVSLEKELSDANVNLQNAEACFEASEEDKNMLKSTINDMSNVIDDMREKVTKAETENESLEDKCIFLSESNADLKKKLSFVMGKLKCLETTLHQMEETTTTSAKDISLRSKLITDLVKQMTLERERLQKQISSLKQENKILVKRVKGTDIDPAVKVSRGDKASSNDFSTENKEALSTNLRISTFQVETAFNETVMDATETVRNIDARQLKPKDIMRVLLILIIPILWYFFIKP